MANETVASSYEAFAAAAPEIKAALLAMGKAVDKGLDKRLSELVKVRVSQINGCLFCLQLHLDVARGLGLTGARIDHLPIWRESPVYDARERAALAWGEVLTLASSPDAVADERTRLDVVFSASEVILLTSAIANINAWNRIAKGLGFPATVAG